MGSELVMFLFMAHRGLPAKMASILNTKLKHNDVASLKDLILERAQDVLEELEGSQASVNRMYHRPQQARPQYNRSNKPRAPQNQPQNWRRPKETQDTTMTMKTIEFTDQGETHSPFDWNMDYFADDQNTEGDYHSDGDQDSTNVRNIEFTDQDQGETHSVRLEQGLFRGRPQHGGGLPL